MINEVDALKERVTAKQKELEAEIARLKVDGTGAANDKISELELKLSQARAVVQNSWDRVTEAGAATLNEWLKRC